MTAKTNLKRRIARFNKAYPHLSIEVSDISTKRAFNVAERRLTKAQDQAKFEKAKARLLSMALDNGVKINPNKIRGVKSLATAKAKVEPIRKFNIAQKKFIARATEYNAKVQGGALPNKNENKFFQVPRTRAELKKFNRALTLLEKTQVDTAKRLMGVEPKDRLSTTLLTRDKERAKQDGEGTFADKQYFERALREAADSRWPELHILFKQIGVKGVNELALTNFSIAEFAESQMESDEFDADTIRDSLSIVLESLSPALKAKVMVFLKDH